MGKKKTPTAAQPDRPAGGPFHAAFAGLAGLRDALPEAPESGAGERPEPPAEDMPAQPAPVWQRHKLVVRHERKGRGGKTVTLLEGVADAETRDTLARSLALGLGCGARVEGETIVVAGDQRTRLCRWLEAQGATRVVLGSG